ncbi:MAG: aspartate carbamoyltransferase catalytic subunit [Clostridia bacterium]
MEKIDFLGLEGVEKSVIENLLARAKFFRDNIVSNHKDLGLLKGKSVVTLFYENSTRTRCSFELAAKYLGAQVINVEVAGSSVKKGESLVDTVVTLDMMQPDVMVVRHSIAGAPQIVAKHVKASVINAGDGLHAHPTQALLDMFTMQEHFGHIDGLNVAIVGDIKHSRVARSNIEGLATMGANVKIFAPQTLLPQQVDKLACKVCDNIEEVFVDSDVVMGLRIQLERQQKGLFPSVGEYNKFYGINKARMALARPNAIVMHPGPVNSGVELSWDILDDPRCVKDEQVIGGVAVRMALLEMLCK